MEMEMEQSPPIIAKKLWNIVRIVFYMLKRGISKNKLMADLLVMLKRSKIAGKAIGDLMLHHHAAMSCRSNDAHLLFVSPREYEFSCSNSPVYPSYYTRRRNHHNHHYHHHHHHRADDIKVVVQRMFDMLNSTEIPEASPLTSLPGFGKSPAVRQLRITDSPFPLKDVDGDHSHVDKAADEYIKNFYKDQLKQQKRSAALESPSRYYLWAR